MDSFYREYLDAIVERRGTSCEKWDYCERVFGRADVLPLWVADMDFPTAPCVVEAIAERAKHPIYGYTDDGAAERAAEVAWIERRYGAKVEPEWILSSPGVVDSVYFCVRALTEEGDGVLIQPPVYGPFKRAVDAFQRRLIENPLVETQDGWEMDFEGLERGFQSGAKMMILCSPHNPVGRVWRRDELQRVADLAQRYGVIVVSDEIHSDFMLDGAKHTRYLSLERSGQSVMLTSATKSFNLAGLRQSSAIVRDAQLREKLRAEIERSHANTPNIFGSVAQTAAYTGGDAWMDAVVEYVQENRDFAASFVRERMPEIAVKPESGTYLLWLDCRGLGLAHEEIMRRLVFEAGVGLNSGLDYGEQGRGFFRMNLATQRARVREALERIEKMVRSIRA